MPDLSIIIVAWNCRDDLDRCLRSIEDSGTRCSRDVIVVDNDSTDGTVAQLERTYPSVRTIVNKENRGFAAANNQALRIVQSRYFLLLNPDTSVRPGALDALTAFLDDHQEAWAVGPMLLNPDGTPQWTGVRFPSNWNVLVESFFLDRVFPRSRLFGRHKEMYESLDEPRAVDYLQGACLMVRSAAIKEIGLLDEQFFMYFEEADWCYRMREAGGSVYYCPSANVVHYGTSELGHFDERRLVSYHRSMLLFYRKHYGLVQLLSLRLILALRSVTRILVWACAGTLRPSLRKSAVTSTKGYVRTLALLTQRVQESKPGFLN